LDQRLCRFCLLLVCFGGSYKQFAPSLHAGWFLLEIHHLHVLLMQPQLWVPW
jgi:hypothetical protein